MKLFEKEAITISKIVTVDMYVTTEAMIKQKPIAVYGNNPKTYELILYIEGHTVTDYNNVIVENKKNSIRYLPKGKIDGEHRVERKEPTVCIDIYFDTTDEMPSVALGFNNQGKLCDKFQNLYHIWNGKKPGYYAKSMSLFYEIIYLFKKSAETYISPNGKAKLDLAYNYILEHYTDYKFDYKELCDSTGLSYSYFSELFNAEYGMSPVKLITKMKIDFAKELLITDHYSISEIAEKCGFENVYYFSNVFKRLVGVSPKNYR